MAARRARQAIVVVFVGLGGLSTTLAPQVPAVKARLHLDAPTLGLALLGSAVGLALAAPVAGAVLHRIHPRAVMAVGFVPFCVGLPFAAVVGSAPALFAVLFVWGFGGGLIDVAMNVEAVAIEAAYGRPIMASFHAGYSIGALAGSGLGALAAAAGATVGTRLVVASCVVGAVGLAAVAAEPAVPRPDHAPGTSGDERRAGRLPPLSWALAALALVALGSFLAEGAVNDWSAVYLHSSLGASSDVAGFGYTTFAVTMVAGRVVGDRLVGRVGARRVVRWATAGAGVCLAAALAVGDPVAGMVGFAVLGLGLANVVPQAFSSAARLGSAGPALAAVTASGYVGLMAGPAVIGGLAGLVGLPAALATIVAVCAVASLCAGALRDRPAAVRSVTDPIGEVLVR